MSLLFLAGCAHTDLSARMRASEIPRGTPAVARAAQAVVVEPIEGDPQPVRFRARVAAGSAYDPIGREGLAWRAAHALATGDGWEVHVGREWATFQLTCPAEPAEACADRFAAALTAPPYGDQELAATAAAARARLTEAGDPDWLAGEVLTCALYEGHRYGHPPEGRAGVLDVITPEDVRSFHARHYVRGAVTAWASDAAARLQERLLALPSTIPPELPTYAPPTRSAGAVLVVEGPAEGGRARIGAAARIGPDHPDWPALWLGFSALRASLGLPPAELEPRRYADLVLEVDAARAAEAANAFARWSAEGITAEQLAALPVAGGAPTLEAVNAVIRAHPLRASVVVVGPAPDLPASPRLLPREGLFR